MAENYSIGLDGGTTESCVFAGGAAVQIYSGRPTYPSVLRVGPTGSCTIPTDLQVPTNRTLHLPFCKRMIGRPPEDGSLRHTVDRIPHAELDSGGPHYVAGERRFDPVEVWSYILGRGRRAAEQSRGGPPQRAVLTVPAYYGVRQCKAILTAANIAGFDMKTTELVTEPLAIAIDQIEAGRQEKTGLYPDKSCVVVVDVGGGTTDITQVVSEHADDKHSYVVEAIEGDNYLGGVDFDQLLEPILSKKAKRAGHVQEPTPDVLRRECENAKIVLSDAQSTSIDLGTDGPPLVVTRAESEVVWKPLVDKISTIMDKLPAVKTGKAPTAVFLAGGVSQMPCIQKLCRTKFPNTRVHVVQDAQQVVARGAWRISEAKNIVIHNVLSTSIGVETRDGDQPRVITQVASRNMRVPTTVTHTLYTNKENPSNLELTFVEGESMEKHLGTVVGEINISGIPACPEGTKINIYLTIEGPGNFLVRATVGNIEKELKVEPPAFLTDLEIEKHKAATACRLDGKAVEDASPVDGALSGGQDAGMGKGADSERESDDGSASDRIGETELTRAAGDLRSRQTSGWEKDKTGGISLDEARIRDTEHGSLANGSGAVRPTTSKRTKAQTKVLANGKKRKARTTPKQGDGESKRRKI